MHIMVNLIIDTTDYDGQKFKCEIEKLVADIDRGRNESRLTDFMMWQIGKSIGDDWRDYQWHETNREEE